MAEEINLFGEPSSPGKLKASRKRPPLADRMRPETIEEFVGDRKSVV